MRDAVAAMGRLVYQLIYSAVTLDDIPAPQLMHEQGHFPPDEGFQEQQSKSRGFICSFLAFSGQFELSK
jgi:hypothetical protein